MKASEFTGHVSLSDTAALLHGNASEERLGSRLISHYRRLMFLPGAYKSTRPSSFHVRSGKLSCISTSSLNSTCMFYMSMGVDEMGQSLYLLIGHSAYKIRD